MVLATTAPGGFRCIKEVPNMPSCPVILDIDQPVTLTCDSSRFGLGAACLQGGKPIAYASRVLTQTEMHYAQVEK